LNAWRIEAHYRRDRDNNEADVPHGKMTTLWSVFCLQNWILLLALQLAGFIFEAKLIIDPSEIISANIQVNFMNHRNLNPEFMDNNNY
jgi:hypothetical protein